MITAWFEIAAQRHILMRAVKVALVVGSILMLINYGDIILGNGLSVKELTKITLTYLVPYCVSTYSSVEAVCAAENKPSINQLMGPFLIGKRVELARCVMAALKSRK